MKKNIFRYITILFFILLLLSFIFTGSSFGFTAEEQSQIDNIVSTMKSRSHNSGCKYNLDNTSTNSIFLSVNKTFNNKTCKYMAIMYWNQQFNITLTNNVIKATCTWSNTHELVSFYYDSDLNCIGYNIDNLPENSSVTFDNVNYYFKSSFAVKDSSGVSVEPFFQLPPEGVLLEEMSKVEMKTTLAEILGLLPAILSVLVSLIALRKALRMLSNFLRKS